MKRKPTMAEVLKAAEPIIKKRTAEANEMVTGLGQQIIQDQAEWLDTVMRDILPPHLYAMGQRGESWKELEDYISQHAIRIIFIPDHLAMRVMIGERVHAQFIPRLLLDGEPVSITPQSPLDGTQN